MKRRIEIIEKTDPVLTVSIHQNSYPEEYVHGAQVFYYTGSMGSETLASGIQDQLVRGLDPENHRKVKANDSYYRDRGVWLFVKSSGGGKALR